MSGVSFGSGAVSRELDVISETLGATKIFLISTSSLTESPERGAVEAAIGSRLVGQSFRSVANTPEALVRQTKDLVLKSGANAIVSLGGSSVIDLAKGVALCLSEGDDFESMRVTFSPEEGMSAPPLNSPKMLHISIPTTLSGSESSFGLGITNEASKEKNVFVDDDGQWDMRSYIPAYVRKYPFIFHESEDSDTFTLCVEQANINNDDNANPFFDDGTPTPLVEQSLDFCKNFQAAWAQTTQFVSTLNDLDLLIERRADMQSPSGESSSLSGFNVIDKEFFICFYFFSQ